jgi:hypothetical protein
MSLLADGDPRFLFGSEADIADLHRLDADAAQNELAVDDLAGVDVHDLAVVPNVPM